MELHSHYNQSYALLPSVENQQKTHLLVGICPHCGAEMEIFSDDLERRVAWTCLDCQLPFTPTDYIRSNHFLT